MDIKITESGITVRSGWEAVYSYSPQHRCYTSRRPHLITARHPHGDPDHGELLSLIGTGSKVKQGYLGRHLTIEELINLQRGWVAGLLEGEGPALISREAVLARISIELNLIEEKALWIPQLSKGGSKNGYMDIHGQRATQ